MTVCLLTNTCTLYTYSKPTYVHKVGMSVPQPGTTLHASTDCPVLLRQQLNPTKQPGPRAHPPLSNNQTDIVLTLSKLKPGHWKGAVQCQLFASIVVPMKTNRSHYSQSSWHICGPIQFLFTWCGPGKRKGQTLLT